MLGSGRITVPVWILIQDRDSVYESLTKSKHIKSRSELVGYLGHSLTKFSEFHGFCATCSCCAVLLLLETIRNIFNVESVTRHL